jgi:hypothetical protein
MSSGVSPDLQSAEAGKRRLGTSFLGEFPIEKYRAKTSAFDVVTKSNHVHSDCETKRERGGMDTLTVSLRVTHHTNHLNEVTL